MNFSGTGQRVLSQKPKPAEPSQLNAALDSAKQTMELFDSIQRWGKSLSNHKTQAVAVVAAVGVGLYLLNQQSKKKKFFV